MLDINCGDDSIPDLITFLSMWKEFRKNPLIFHRLMFKVVKFLVKILILFLLHKENNRLKTCKIRNQKSFSH